VTLGEPLFRNIKASTASASPAGNSTTPPPNQGNSNGTNLSTGARAGVGAAIALSAIAGLSLAYFLFVRRRQRRSKTATQEPIDSKSGDFLDEKVAGGFKAELSPLGSNPRAELHADPISPPEMPAEKDPKPPMELHGDALPKEKLPPVELEGTTVLGDWKGKGLDRKSTGWI
jgi:hypothetical protein